MYEIIMHSEIGTTRGFMNDLRTYDEAYEVCESYGWVFFDENDGLGWNLEIVETDDEDCDDF